MSPSLANGIALEGSGRDGASDGLSEKELNSDVKKSRACAVGGAVKTHIAAIAPMPHRVLDVLVIQRFPNGTPLA
jgi:hypothetical protein